MNEYELYEGALREISKRGWRSGDFVGEDGRICALGALSFAAFGKAKCEDMCQLQDDGVISDAFLWTNESAPILTRLAKRHLLAKEYDLNKPTTQIFGPIMMVNDECGQEVIEDLLRKATRLAKAKEAEQLPDPLSEPMNHNILGVDA